MKHKLCTLLIYLLFSKIVLADLNIINKGKVLKSKPYSVNEATLVVSKSKKIYICTVIDNMTKCIISKKPFK